MSRRRKLVAFEKHAAGRRGDGIRATHRPPASRRRRALRIVTAATIVVLLAITGTVAYAYFNVTAGIHRSAIRPQTSTSTGSSVPQNTGETNILVMGLDSRVDEDGNPLPAAIYNTIHAGTAGDGGYNTNVLMFIHIPAGGGKAVGMSIPRDDYAALSGAPDGVSSSKIKEAYGLALDQKLRQLHRQGITGPTAYQQARDFARQTEIQTVSTFLGGVQIDHFIEITMAAFAEIAGAVQPITVCLNHATRDAFSGANFSAGVQQLDASQAMSFVRQRRDTSSSGFSLTDLDRTRRQQAFIVSLAVKLRQARTFTNLGTLQTLINTAKQYIAVDQGFDFLTFASQAQRLSGGGITFQTLPIQRYATIHGKDVNLVDLTQIHSIVAALITPPPATPTPSSTPTPKNTSRSPTPRPSPSTSSYTDTTTPLASGAIPCVN